MLSFKEYIEVTGYEPDVTDINESRYGRKGWVRGVGITLQLRINHLSNKVKSTNDTNEKLDRLSDLIRTHSYLSTLSISSDLNDKSLLKGRKLK